MGWDEISVVVCEYQGSSSLTKTSDRDEGIKNVMRATEGVEIGSAEAERIRLPLLLMRWVYWWLLGSM